MKMSSYRTRYHKYSRRSGLIRGDGGFEEPDAKRAIGGGTGGEAAMTVAAFGEKWR
ncbi:hypothetical protein KSP39_PZI002234 [Platanthera zijinensis]|uniref:Uncharacterized protein n=1 Tax=Platanthera zijinensis TaxID=2320716 RepID=A0AAP0BXH2_9ASPA